MKKLKIRAFRCCVCGDEPIVRRIRERALWRVRCPGPAHHAAERAREKEAAIVRWNMLQAFASGRGLDPAKMSTRFAMAAETA